MIAARLADVSEEFLIGFAQGAAVVALAAIAVAMVYATWQMSLRGRTSDAS